MTLLQCVTGDSLPEEGGVADCSEPNHDAMEAREDSRSMSRDFLSPPCHAQRTVVYDDSVTIASSVRIH